MPCQPLVVGKAWGFTTAKRLSRSGRLLGFSRVLAQVEYKAANASEVDDFQAGYPFHPKAEALNPIPVEPPDVSGRSLQETKAVLHLLLEAKAHPDKGCRQCTPLVKAGSCAGLQRRVKVYGFKAFQGLGALRKAQLRSELRGQDSPQPSILSTTEACAQGHAEVVQTLLQSGADKDFGCCNCCKRYCACCQFPPGALWLIAKASTRRGKPASTRRCL